MVVVSGMYTLRLDEVRHDFGPGDEVYIAKGTMIRGTCAAGTRTIHAFEKKRASRVDRDERKTARP